MPKISLHQDIPGYAQAALRENELRAVPFLGLPEHIGGVPAAPLTLRRVQWLTFCRSPFLLKLDAEALEAKPDIAADTLLFLWIVSPEFKPGNLRARDRFFDRHRHVLKLKALTVIQDALDYVQEAFLDAGDDTPDYSRSYYSSAAAVVGFFHRHYGLPIDVWDNSWVRRLSRKLSGQPNALDIPLRIAFQLIRVHQKHVNPEQTFFNRLSQPAIDRYLAELNAPKTN